jgi:hypothetical protein
MGQDLESLLARVGREIPALAPLRDAERGWDPAPDAGA